MSATKHDSNKARLGLLPWTSLTEIAKVLSFGADKYEKYNWRKGFSYERVLSATLRHVASFSEGEDNDPETGLSHLAHAGCNVLFLLHFVITGTGTDDRPNTKGVIDGK